MKIENKIRAFAGGVILVGCILTIKISPTWIWLPIFVGANLLQSSFTKFCPLEIVLKKIDGQNKV